MGSPGCGSCPYGFENTPQRRADVEQDLTTTVEVNAQFFELFRQNQGTALRKLMMGFCRDLHDRQSMPFICSQAIWEAVSDFWESRELPKKLLSHPDSYFEIREDRLDPHVARKIGGFLTNQQAKGFAILWAIPYIYEFLLAKQVISAAVFEGAIAASHSLKIQLMQGFQKHLWQYDFVHRWQRPNSISEEEFAAEAEQFARSIEQSEPLSDQPVERPSFESMVSDLAENMAQRITAKPTQDAFPERHREKPKPPKPRRSPLEEANKLQNKKPSQAKKSGKKKK